MAASTASLRWACVCDGAAAVVDRSAKARFLLPALWAVKREGFDLEGRARPGVLGVEEVEARRVDRVEVKVVLEEGLREEGFEVRGRGRP